MTGLESYLLELARYGKPMLTQGSRGWWCKVSMRVASKGCSFDVISEHTHKSPIEATTQCLERVRVALKGFGEIEDVEKLR